MNLQQKLAATEIYLAEIEKDHARESNPKLRTELQARYENIKARRDLMRGGVDPDEAGALPIIPAPAQAAPEATEPEADEPAKPKRAKRERPKSRPQRWADACAAIRAAVDKARGACDEVEQAFADLEEVRGEYIEWKENLSENLANSAVGEKLQAVEDLDIDDAHSELDSAISDLESKVDEAEGLDLPLGFGRD